jgi:hypothetical protein
MLVKINKPEALTPMYEVIWEEIERMCVETYSTIEGITLLTDRIAILKVNDDSMLWLHICRPRVLYREVNTAKGQSDRLTSFGIYRRLNMNSVSGNCWEGCQKCRYWLTKPEQIIVKLGILGERR